MTRKRLLVYLLFLVALGLIFYPFLGNYLFENRADSLVRTVERTMQQSDDASCEAALLEAEKYNQVLFGGHIQLKDPFVETKTEEIEAYESLVRTTEEGVMGVIEIPSIEVSLPIYHGTTQQVLERGVGHLMGTSLPVGGESTHTVLTGHSGLSRAKLFTDLEKLEGGGCFLPECDGTEAGLQSESDQGSASDGDGRSVYGEREGLLYFGDLYALRGKYSSAIGAGRTYGLPGGGGESKGFSEKGRGVEMDGGV